MKRSIKKYSNIMRLLSIIMFFILGAIMYTRPDFIVLFVSYVIGGLITTIGLFKCIKNYLYLKKDNTTSSKDMIFGIVAIVIGLVFIFLAGVIESLVRLVIGGWILFSGINNLIETLRMKSKDNKFIVSLILSFILIAGSLYTILKANLAFKAIGIVLMIYSLVEIFAYIFKEKDIELGKTVIETMTKVIDAVVVKDNKNKK